MLRPERIMINGRRWRIKYVPGLLHDRGAYGFCHDNGLIEIDDSLDRDHDEPDTLLHELLHAVLRQQGREIERHEETYVRAIATGLLPVLRDNKHLVQYLTRKPK